MNRLIAKMLFVISSLTLPLVWIAGDANLREMTFKIDGNQKAIELHLRKEPALDASKPRDDRAIE